MTWNVNRHKFNYDEVALNVIRQNTSRGITLFQDVLCWPAHLHVPGWQRHTQDDCLVAVAAPSEMCGEARFPAFSRRIASAVYRGAPAVTSVYLAESGKTYEEFEQTVNDWKG